MPTRSILDGVIPFIYQNGPGILSEDSVILKIFPESTKQLYLLMFISIFGPLIAQTAVTVAVFNKNTFKFSWECCFKVFRKIFPSHRPPIENAVENPLPGPSDVEDPAILEPTQTEKPNKENPTSLQSTAMQVERPKDPVTVEPRQMESSGEDSTIFLEPIYKQTEWPIQDPTLLDPQRSKEDPAILEHIESDQPNMQNTMAIVGEVTLCKDEALGEGTFGCVFKGTCREGPCAIKVLYGIGKRIILGLPSVPQRMDNLKGVQEKKLKGIKNECKSLLDLHHPNIVKLFYICVYPNTDLPCLVMELLDCSLSSYLAEISGDLPLATQISLSCNIGDALAYLHNHKPKPVIHRDLCGDNVLIQKGNGAPVAKIADFGICRFIDLARMTQSLTILGHRSGYLPCEGLSKDYNLSLDIHMFGAIMIQTVQAVENIDSSDMREDLLKKIPESHPLKEIIVPCVANNKEDRPTAETVSGQLKLLQETQSHDH